MMRLATWEYDKSIFRRCEEQWKWFFFVKEVKPLRTYSEDKASHTHFVFFRQSYGGSDMRIKKTLGMRLTANAQNTPQDRAMSALLLRDICNLDSSFT